MNTNKRHEEAVHLLQKAYVAFNARDIAAALLLMHEQVAWPNGWEGGYVYGLDKVRDYWSRQWAAIDPHVEPLDFAALPDGRTCVTVHQLVRDLQGNAIMNVVIQHIYTIENGLVKTMEIVHP